MAHDFQVHTEDDHMPGRRIGTVLAVMVAMGLLCVGVAWALLSTTRSAARPSGEFAERQIAPEPVESGVEQTLIDKADHAADLGNQRRRMIDRYEWVDRAAGLIRVPIERAIDLYIEEQTQ